MNCPICNKKNSSIENIVLCDCGIEYCNSISTIEIEEMQKIKDSQDIKKGIFYKVEKIGSLTKYLNKKGQIHREDDNPALVFENGSKFWYKNGLPHREGDSPATIYRTGSMMWYKNGALHRENGPALIIARENHESWFIDGKFIK